MRRLFVGTEARVLLLVAFLTACGAGHDPGTGPSPTSDDVLRQTWAAYVSRFVQPDGRVVDPKAGGITTSEGQAYAMLRAVWMEDRTIFDRTLAWATDFLLDRNAALTATRLPSDWLLLDTATGTLSLGSDRDSQYSYDAFRTHWRVRLDGVLFGEERRLR